MTSTILPADPALSTPAPSAPVTAPPNHYVNSYSSSKLIFCGHRSVAGIVTTSLSAAERFKRDARAGIVPVNLPTAGTELHLPFGGTGVQPRPAGAGRLRRLVRGGPGGRRLGSALAGQSAFR
jgi:hypothetical protein